jgi:dTDP-4-dehydrorhamnose reductase
MKVLVTGAGGMLGREMVGTCVASGHEVVALTRTELDVLESDEVAHRLVAERPDAVIHCAAYTAVDRAEDEPDVAMAVNGEATRYLAEACRRIGARLVYPSTDYVFDGAADRPYRPEDPVRPLSAYGRSKLAGEGFALEAQGALVVRTSWLYGTGGKNFVETMLRLAGERAQVEVVTDQIGRPTWTRSLAESIEKLLIADLSGRFHATNGGPAVNWFGFAREIFAQAGVSVGVMPTTSASFVQRAVRPPYSVLDCSRTERWTGPLRDWRKSLADYLAERPTATEVRGMSRG